MKQTFFDGVAFTTAGWNSPTQSDWNNPTQSEWDSPTQTSFTWIISPTLTRTPTTTKQKK